MRLAITIDGRAYVAEVGTDGLHLYTRRKSGQSNDIDERRADTETTYQRPYFGLRQEDS